MTLMDAGFNKDSLSWKLKMLTWATSWAQIAQLPSSPNRQAYCLVFSDQFHDVEFRLHIREGQTKASSNNTALVARSNKSHVVFKARHVKARARKVGKKHTQSCTHMRAPVNVENKSSAEFFALSGKIRSRIWP